MEDGQTIGELIPNGNVVIIQREFPKIFADYRKIVEIARRGKKPIVFDLDDLLFFLPEIHPDRQGHYYGPTLLPMFQALIEADLVTVSTPTLRDVLTAFNPNVVVLQNYFDDQLWRFSPPVRKDASREGLTIGFMGTNSHRSDLAYVAPVLLELIERYPEKIRIHFWGAQPPAELSALPQVQWTSQYFSSYKDFAAFFQTQSADIFIAPLVDHLFNRCKSSIKFFEYSALGAPGVFSRLEPYTDVITHGHNGLLADSLDEWRTCLIQLIENDELRFQLATNAQATIKENWLLSQNAFRWNDALQRALEVASSNRPQNANIINMVSSINLQLVETFNAKEALEQALRGQVAEKEQAERTLMDQVVEREQTIQSLTAQLNQTRNEVEQLKTEVLQYALSKSWQMTRPIRIVGRKLKRFLGEVNV